MVGCLPSVLNLDTSKIILAKAWKSTGIQDIRVEYGCTVRIADEVRYAVIRYTETRDRERERQFIFMQTINDRVSYLKEHQFIGYWLLVLSGRVPSICPQSRY